MPTAATKDVCHTAGKKPEVSIKPKLPYQMPRIVRDLSESRIKLPSIERVACAQASCSCSGSCLCG